MSVDELYGYTTEEKVVTLTTKEIDKYKNKRCKMKHAMRVSELQKPKLHRTFLKSRLAMFFASCFCRNSQNFGKVQRLQQILTLFRT